MNILSIYNGPHNSNITLIMGGKIKHCIEEERLIRIKAGNDWGRSPQLALDFLKEKYISNWDTVYIVYVSPNDDYDFYKNHVNRTFNTVLHHDAHAYGAYYTSNIQDKCLIVSIDNGGVESNGKMFLGENGNLKFVENISNDVFTPAYFYMYITTLLGWKQLKDEGKVTGLAPYGKFNKDMKNEMSEIMRYENLNFIFSKENELKFTEKYKRVSDIDLRKDIAYNGQKHFEELMINYITDLHKKYPEYNNLVLSGGPFANVKLNMELNKLPYFKEIYVYPPMNDGGLSLGGALYFMKQLNAIEKPFRHENVFYGIRYTDAEIYDCIKEFNFDIKPLSLNETSTLLNNGKIIGLFQDGFEYGPRALGARSILMRATNPDGFEKLNNRLGRHETMPFAPAVLKEYANNVFHITKSEYTAEFMTMCYDTRKEWISRIPSAIHPIDKTARPQLVNKEYNKLFYNIIEGYYNITGIPLIINTSFNSHDEPIINSPREALLHLEKNTIDYLIINNHLITKKKNKFIWQSN